MTQFKLQTCFSLVFLLLQLLHSGECLKECGSIVYDPDRNICCEDTVHVMPYENTCCCGSEILDASVDICCEGTIRARVTQDKPDCCQCPDERLDIAILADNSEGLSPDDISTLRGFVQDVITNLNVNNGDIRVSLVVFTHLVFVEFHLDDFSNVTDMITAIDLAENRTGGTETGKALKKVREDVFQEGQGDRADVPNVVLLITDGKSNTKPETVTQADLLKATGAYIIVVGVGADVDKLELNYVSSSGSAHNVSSFDGLDETESVITGEFFLCTETPTKPLCGDTVYDPQTQVCCQNTPVDCGSSSADYGCCGTSAYNINSEICCYDNVFSVGSPAQDYQCCGSSNVYNTSAELCCTGNPVPVAGSPQDYSCCGTSAAHISDDLCCDSLVVPVDGSNTDYLCCGTSAAHVSDALCCDDMVVPVTGSNTDFQCCGYSAAHISDDLCCDYMVVPVAGSNTDYQCCGYSAAHVSEDLCCDSIVVPVSGSSTDYECCGASLAFNVNTEICCLGTPVSIEDGCCGDDEFFDPSKQVCCAGIVQPIQGNDGSLTGCCDGVSYDARCLKCEFDQLVPVVNESTHICCSGKFYELIYDNNCCCGEELFDSTLQVCCNGEIIDRPTWDKSDCCECRGAKLDIAIVADHSETVEPFHDQLITFIKSLITSSSVDDDRDRVALIVYTHNVYEVFDLNDYGTAVDMKAAIDNWSFGTGGTNTVGALNTLNSIFTTGKGDRSDATDVVVLIADGNSNEPNAAIAEAAALKAQGIKIIAVGIEGDVDFDELNAIASSPSNVHNVTDFDALVSLHIPMRTSVGDECFDDPIKPPQPECNGVPYDDEYYMCCDGIVQPRLGGKRARCCGDKSYDEKYFICCDESVLQPAVAGKDTECCCRQSYDPVEHICCGNDVRRRTAGEFTECCGNFKYDNRSEVCCYDKVRVSFGPDSTQCCNTKSYNSNCYSCDASFNISPLYDPSKQVCCDGNIEAVKFGDKSCCCGNEQFNLIGKLCCNGNIREVPDVSTCACCGDRIYDVVKQVCCDGATKNKPYGNMTMCCGKKVMDAQYHLCCGGQIVEKSSAGDIDCCDGVPFDPRVQVCCKDKLSDLPTNPSEDSKCCGRKLINPETHFCCGGNVYNRASGKGCCGTENYSHTTHICIDGDLITASPSKLSRCGSSSCDNTNELCCAGSVQSLPVPGYTQCCYGISYDIRKATCCMGSLFESKAGKRSTCCLDKAYNPKKRICCDGRLVRKILPSANSCCGRKRSFDPRRQICCNGRVNYRMSGITTQCCGKKSFDPACYICCDDNILQHRKYGESTGCCGTNVYHPKFEHCCNGEVIPKDDSPLGDKTMVG